MRILLAEDHPHEGTRTQLLLGMAGHDVALASTGDEAFERFEETPFPVVITDLSNRRLNGFELCHRIRKRQQAEYVYIIVLVPLGQAFQFQDGQDADVDDVLTVPLEADILRTRLRVAERMLNLYRELDHLRRLIPICAYCKKIRQEQGLWQQLESYFSEHSHAVFSHTICPDCAEKEFGAELREQRSKQTSRDSAGSPAPGPFRD
jgi:sigma-B regulation protein RsbU (phosphoserine phosphatase)